MKRVIFLATIFLVASGNFNDAVAWGPEGHALIVDMAEAHLDLQAEASVSRLLATEGLHHLDDISSWPDSYRVTHPETGPWHFVDIPLNAPRYDESRDCYYDEHDHHVDELSCVVAKLPYFVAQLSDQTLSDEERLTALKWVVHLAGDIHQPLHTANNNDKGGNTVHLHYFEKSTNLHAVWDGGVIEYHYSWHLGKNYSFDHEAVRQAALGLDREISCKERTRWTQSGLVSDINTKAVEWADESHGLALDAYAELSKRRSKGWAKRYQAYAWPVIEGQISKASVRLAEILNEALH